MTPAVLVLIQGIIQVTPTAIALWNALQPALKEGREPTVAEWAQIEKLRDTAHQQVQSET
jgi:hypothetical protein